MVLETETSLHWAVKPTWRTKKVTEIMQEKINTESPATIWSNKESTRVTWHMPNITGKKSQNWKRYFVYFDVPNESKNNLHWMKNWSYTVKSSPSVFKSVILDEWATHKSDWRGDYEVGEVYFQLEPNQNVWDIIDDDTCILGKDRRKNDNTR